MHTRTPQDHSKPLIRAVQALHTPRNGDGRLYTKILSQKMKVVFTPIWKKSPIRNRTNHRPFWSHLRSYPCRDRAQQLTTSPPSSSFTAPLSSLLTVSSPGHPSRVPPPHPSITHPPTSTFHITSHSATTTTHHHKSCACGFRVKTNSFSPSQPPLFVSPAARIRTQRP